jgi:uncharacterized protein (DUF433 family)
MTIHAEAPPLKMDDSGTIRVAGTRVTLETLLEHYLHGYSVEQLAEAFPTVTLADIHTVIGYSLRHREEVEAYLQRQQRDSDELRQKLESIPANAQLRQQLQAIKRAREGQDGASAAGR